MKGRFGFNQMVITPHGTGVVIGRDVSSEEESYTVQYSKKDCNDKDGKFDQATWLKLCPNNGSCCIRSVPANSIVPVVEGGPKIKV